MKLKNRTAIITGAGGAIGSACAAAFAREGANLVLVDISEGAVKNSAKQVLDTGAQVLSYAADICDEAAVDNAVKGGVERFGGIDILVNLAGSQGPGAPVWEVSTSAWKKCMEINLFGTFLICKKVISQMVSAGYGRVINVASGAGTHPMSYFSAYSASKAGVIHFSRTIAEELKSYGITINSIGVRGISPMWQEVVNAEGGRNTSEGVREMIKNGFRPVPEENVPVFLFLASEESGHVTGQYFEANPLPACIIGKGR